VTPDKSAQSSYRAHLEPAQMAKHIEALFALAKIDRIGGYIPSDLLVAYYIEACHEAGIEPRGQQSVLTALGKKVKRKRMRIEGRQVTCYLLPRQRSRTTK